MHIYIHILDPVPPCRGPTPVPQGITLRPHSTIATVLTPAHTNAVDRKLCYINPSSLRQDKIDAICSLFILIHSELTIGNRRCTWHMSSCR